MKEEFICNVYDSLQGLLMDEACVPGVQSVFEEGMPCQEKYTEMLSAYERLCRRLDAENEDRDVETIISSLMEISRILGYEMFRYGAEFAQVSPNKENAP